jgi:putative solute:sodium symporter small subunit
MLRSWRFNRMLIAALLCLWAAVTFGIPYFSQNLKFTFLGWPFGFWVAAQGALLVYLLIVALYAWIMNHRDALQERMHKSHDGTS